MAEIDYSKFSKSLEHLSLQYENFKTLSADTPQIMQEAVAESVIQRFETCYDCMWKVLKRYLRDELGIPDLPHSPKPILRIANENRLFSDTEGTRIEDWLRYADARTYTAHDNSGEKAAAALALMKQFIPAAKSLLTKMTEQ